MENSPDAATKALMKVPRKNDPSCCSWARLPGSKRSRQRLAEAFCVYTVRQARRPPSEGCTIGKLRTDSTIGPERLQAVQRTQHNGKPAGLGCDTTACQSCSEGPSRSMTSSAAFTCSLGTARARAASFKVAMAWALPG